MNGSRQVDRVLTYMQEHPEGISAKVAMDHMGITALHSRISELRSMGFNIGKRHESYKDMYGNTVNVYWYYLAGDSHVR